MLQGLVLRNVSDGANSCRTVVCAVWLTAANVSRIYEQELVNRTSIQAVNISLAVKKEFETKHSYVNSPLSSGANSQSCPQFLSWPSWGRTDVMINTCQSVLWRTWFAARTQSVQLWMRAQPLEFSRRMFDVQRYGLRVALFLRSLVPSLLQFALAAWRNSLTVSEASQAWRHFTVLFVTHWLTAVSFVQSRTQMDTHSELSGSVSRDLHWANPPAGHFVNLPDNFAVL